MTLGVLTLTDFKPTSTSLLRPTLNVGEPWDSGQSHRRPPYHAMNDRSLQTQPTLVDPEETLAVLTSPPRSCRSDRTCQPEASQSAFQPWAQPPHCQLPAGLLEQRWATNLIDITRYGVRAPTDVA